MRWCTALSIVPPPLEGLEVPPALAARWDALAPAIRRHLAGFLADPAVVVPPRVRVEAAAAAGVPAAFLDDVAAGGAALRAAFPDLTRTLAALDAPGAGAGATLGVRIACEGTHDAPFHGFMLPTRRRVRFDELHLITLDATGAPACDRVAIDLRGIVRRLVGG